MRWTAPEAMVRPYAPNIKADVWSFGVLMFEVLTYGSLPYKGATVAFIAFYSIHNFTFKSKPILCTLKGLRTTTTHDPKSACFLP